jgi:hypothetical protein
LFRLAAGGAGACWQAATLAWFQLVNIGGALLAAVPIALVLALTVGAQRIRLALVIGGMTGSASPGAAADFLLAGRLSIPPPVVAVWVGRRSQSGMVRS